MLLDLLVLKELLVLLGLLVLKELLGLLGLKEPSAHLDLPALME